MIPVQCADSSFQSHDRTLDIMRRHLPEVERYPENLDHLDLANGHAAWLSQAEELWFNLCEELMLLMEDTQLSNDWLIEVEPLVKLVVNFVSVGNFFKERKKAYDYRHTGEVWWLRPLARHVRQPLNTLFDHIDQHPARIPIWTGDRSRLPVSHSNRCRLSQSCRVSSED